MLEGAIMEEVSSGQKKSNRLLLPFLKSWENKKTGIKKVACSTYIKFVRFLVWRF